MPSSCSNGIRAPEHNHSDKRKRASAVNCVNKYPNQENKPKNKTSGSNNKTTTVSCKNNGAEHATSKADAPSRCPPNSSNDSNVSDSPVVTVSASKESPVVISVAKVAVQPPTKGGSTDGSTPVVQPGHVNSTEQQQNNLSETAVLIPLPPQEMPDPVLSQQQILSMPYKCTLPCTIPDCQGCYPSGTSTASVQLIPQRPFIPVCSANSSGPPTSCINNGPPGGPCYILVGQDIEAQKQLYATQMALSQMNLNASMASDAAVGVPLVQNNGYVRDGSVPASFMQGLPQSNALQMLPQQQLKGPTLINNASMYNFAQGIMPSAADPATFAMQSCSATGSTGCVTPIQSMYNTTPSNASTASCLTEQVPNQPQLPVDTGNPMSNWPTTTYLDPSGMWFPSAYAQPFYSSLQTNPVLNYTNAGTVMPTLPADRCYHSPNISCDKVPGSLPAYHSNLSGPLYSNDVQLPIKSFYGLGQPPNLMCASSPNVSAGTSQPPFAAGGTSWLNPYYQQLLLQSLASSRTTAQTGQYHPLMNYGLQSSDRSGGTNSGRKRGSLSAGSRTIPCKGFDESELNALKLRVNPPELDQSLLIRTRYFVIKSDCEFNIHQSIRHGVWCSTRTGNQCLDEAFHSVQVPKSTTTTDAAYCDRDLSMSASASRISTGPFSHMPGHIILFFSVRSSGYLSGVAEMIGPVNPQKRCSIWQDARFRGEIPVRWLYVKNVPNNLMKHIIVDSRPVTLLRDASEISPSTKGEELLTIVHNYCPQRMPSVSQPYCG